MVEKDFLKQFNITREILMVNRDTEREDQGPEI